MKQMLNKYKILYFMRHGETDANKLGLMCGSQWDIELNEKGRFQAYQAALSTKKKGIEINCIISSPLLRARTTAQYFAEMFEIPVMYLDDLKEWDLGEWNAKPSSEISSLFDSNQDPINGEKLKCFQARIAKAISYIHKSYENSLVVSHGAVWKQLCTFFKIDYIQIENCRIAKVSFNQTNDEILGIEFI